MADDKQQPAPLLDRVIGFLAPERGARRAAARLNIQRYSHAQSLFAQRKYDGAATGRRQDGWQRTGSSANAEVQGGAAKLRASSRDLARNNSWFNRGLNVVTNYVVGDGIHPQISSPSKLEQRRVAEAYRLWAGSKECDHDGRHNMVGLQQLAMKATAESGECLVRRVRLPAADTKTLPIDLQVLEADFLDPRKSGTSGDNIILQGIEFTPQGKRAAYWLFPAHPGENNIAGIANGLQSVRVPAEDIIHLYRVDRPGQIRGVPWGHTAINRAKDLDDAHDAYLWRQKIAACFTAFVYDDNPDGSTASSYGESLEPGAIEVLPSGKQVTFANPPGVDGFAEFSDDQLYAIASGFGITFEALTGKLKGVNFLSGRIGQLDMAKNVGRWQSSMFVPVFCDGVFEWFAEAAGLVGIGSARVAVADWVLPTRDMLDPQKEFNIEKQKVRAGKPAFDMMRGMGYVNPEQALARKAEENELFDTLGLVLDIDPRNMSAAGNAIGAAAVPEEAPEAAPTKQETDDDENT